jgi:hypothetical protein
MQYTKVLAMGLSVLTVLILLIAAPAQAIQLSVDLPQHVGVDQPVTFELNADIQSGEIVPVDSVTLAITGPNGTQICTFNVNGTPISGCEGITITPDLSTQEFGNMTATGWNGTSVETVNFGYGYGFGNDGTPTELTWTITFTATEAGKYSVDYQVNADGAVFDLQEAGVFNVAGSDKQAICKNGKTMLVSKNAVPAQLKSGATLGAC